MRKGIAFFILIILMAATLLYGYLYVPQVQNKIAKITEENFSEDNIYSNMESLSMRLDQEILNGSDSFVVYLKGMDVDEIGGINKSVNGIYGSGLSYQQVGSIGKTYTKVKITVWKTINYYALNAYVNKEPIPEDQPKAKELYNAICCAMGTAIKEDMTDFQKELALHDYLVSHCKYSEDAKQSEDSDIYRAYGALVNGDAVCNGYAEAMDILLRCVGIESEFVIGRAYSTQAGWVDHAWNLVNIDGNWYHLDATWDDPVPDQGDKLIHSYFNVTDDIIGQNHEWERDNYPKAATMDYNYYEKMDKYFSDIEGYQNEAYSDLIYGNSKRFEGVVENYQENEEDMQFVFEGNSKYDKIGWQTFQLGTYSVLIIDVE